MAFCSDALLQSRHREVGGGGWGAVNPLRLPAAPPSRPVRWPRLVSSNIVCTAKRREVFPAFSSVSRADGTVCCGFSPS